MSTCDVHDPNKEMSSQSEELLHSGASQESCRRYHLINLDNQDNLLVEDSLPDLVYKSKF